MPSITSRPSASRTVKKVFGANALSSKARFGPRRLATNGDLLTSSRVSSTPSTSAANVGAAYWGLAHQAESLSCTIDDTISALLAEVAKPTEPRAQWLNKFMGVVIVLNVVTMALELDLGPDVDTEHSQDEHIWRVIEVAFCLCYLCEFCLRINMERWNWVRSWWNWLDCGIVVAALMENIMVQLMSTEGMGLQTLVVFRVAQLARLVRLVRLIRMFRGVYVTVLAFKSAMMSIAYICFLMIFGLFVCAIFTTSAIGRGPLCHKQLGKDATGCDYFGTIVRSMYSLFELMTLEGWENVGRPISMEQPAMAVFFFLFIMFFTFGLLNMVAAIVVDKTLTQATAMDDADERQLKMQAAEELQRIRTIFHELDATGSGNIRRRAFFNALRTKPNVCQSFDALGIPTADAWSLYSILDGNGDNLVSMEELLEGCARIRGIKGNSDWDLMTIKGKLGRVARQVEQLSADMHRALNVPEQNIEAKDASQTCVSFLEEEVPKPVLPGSADEPEGPDPALWGSSGVPKAPSLELVGSSERSEVSLSAETVVCRKKSTTRTRRETPRWKGSHVSTGESLSSLGPFRVSGRSDDDFSSARSDEAEVMTALAAMEDRLGSFQDAQVEALGQMRNEEDVRAAEQDSLLRRIEKQSQAWAKSQDDRFEALMAQVAKLQSLVIAPADFPFQHEKATEVGRRT